MKRLNITETKRCAVGKRIKKLDYTKLAKTDILNEKNPKKQNFFHGKG